MSEHKNLKPGWKVWRFDQMATNVNVRIDNPSKSGLEHYVGLEHLDTNSLKIRRWGSPDEVEATKLIFKKGDIIFGRRRAYQRKLGVAEFDGICSAHAMVLRAKPEVVLQEFLPFFMQSDLFMNRAVEISVGSLSPTINWKTMALQEFVLPPLKEQHRIVGLLNSIENCLIEFFEASNAATSLIKSFSAHEFNNLDSKKKTRLSEHFTIVSGQVDPKNALLSTLPLIAPNHIESGTGKILKIESAIDQAAISGKFLFEEGSVLYSKIRPNLVKATIAQFRGLCSGDMFALVPKETLRKEYLLEILLSDSFTQFALSGITGTAIPRLNRNQFVCYECHVPSIEEQDRFLTKIATARNAKVAFQERIEKTKKLKLSFDKEHWGE